MGRRLNFQHQLNTVYTFPLTRIVSLYLCGRICFDLQSALGVQDLGQFYFKPIKDGNGSIVLVTINQIRENRVVYSTHVKWMPLPKIQKRIACAFDGLAAPELLLASISVSSPQLLKFVQRSLFVGKFAKTQSLFFAYHACETQDAGKKQRRCSEGACARVVFSGDDGVRAGELRPAGVGPLCRVPEAQEHRGPHPHHGAGAHAQRPAARQSARVR